MVPAFRHVLISSFLETSRRQIVACVTVRFSGGSSNTRKSLAAEQVVTIGTAFNLADLLDEPGKSEVKLALLEFARTRTHSDLASLTTDSLEEWLLASRNARLELWPITRVALLNEDSRVVRTAIGKSINDALDAWERLRKAMTEEVATAARLSLSVIGVTTFFLVGFFAGGLERRQIWPQFTFALLFGLVALLIVDIERANQGFIQVRLSSLNSLISELEADLGDPPG